MEKITLKDKTYSYFRSTVDHIYMNHKYNTIKELTERFDLYSMSDEMQRYLLGFVDYVYAKCGVIINEKINYVDYNVDEYIFTEGAEKLLEVLGENKRAELIKMAIPEFKKYGLIITSVMAAK